MRESLKILRNAFLTAAIASIAAGCSSHASSKYFGQTAAPKGNVLRYVTGSEPESLDPALPNGQPEARILMALYDGLIEYHPITLDPIPGVAEVGRYGRAPTEYISICQKMRVFKRRSHPGP